MLRILPAVACAVAAWVIAAAAGNQASLLAAARVLHVLDGWVVSARLLITTLSTATPLVTFALYRNLTTCYGAEPAKSFVFRRLEAALNESAPVAAAPIPELHIDASLPWAQREAAICDGDGSLRGSERWTRPVLLRGLLKDAAAIAFWQKVLTNRTDDPSDEAILDAIIAGLAAEPVSLASHTVLSQRWEQIRECPAARRDARRHTKFEEATRLLGLDDAELYVAFQSALLFAVDRLEKQHLEETGGEARGFAWDERLLRLCGGFGGYSSDAFMGKGRSVGSPMHHAFMKNLFAQLHGDRKWTMVSPRYSPYLQPLQGVAYANGFRVHRDWGRGEWAAWFAAVPRFEATLHAGDVLYIPPWWWHATTHHEGGGPTAGISHRGNAFRARTHWREWPVVRAAFSDGPYDVLASDLGQTWAIWLHGSEKEAHAVQVAQHARGLI